MEMDFKRITRAVVIYLPLNAVNQSQETNWMTGLVSPVIGYGFSAKFHEPEYTIADCCVLPRVVCLLALDESWGALSA